MLSGEVKLKNIATFINGKAFKPSEWSDVGKPIIRIQNLTNEKSKFNYYEGECDEKYLVQKGDILISWSATLGVFEWDREDAWLNQHIFKVKFDRGDIDKDYFKFLIETKIHEMESYVHGSTMKHITKSDFEEITLNLPKIKEQKEVAATFKNLNTIIEKRRQSLAKIDQLAQSIFLDMFGDPVSNPKSWSKKKLLYLVSKEKHSLKRGPFGGALKKEIFKEEGYLVYEQYHALNDDFTLKRYFIDEKKFKELKDFSVKPNDVIISCSGVNLGRLAIVPEGAREGIINQALLKITLDSGQILNEFFVILFRNPQIRRSLLGEHRGSGVPNFPPMSEVKEFEFIVPPLELQQKYLIKLKRIKTLKGIILQEQDRIEKLQQSLSQKFFGQ